MAKEIILADDVQIWTGEITSSFSAEAIEGEKGVFLRDKRDGKTFGPKSKKLGYHGRRKTSYTHTIVIDGVGVGEPLDFSGKDRDRLEKSLIEKLEKEGYRNMVPHG